MQYLGRRSVVAYRMGSPILQWVFWIMTSLSDQRHLRAFCVRVLRSVDQQWLMTLQPKTPRRDFPTTSSQSRESRSNQLDVCLCLRAVVSHRTLFFRTLKIQGHGAAWDDGAVNALPTLCLCTLSTSAACLLSSSICWRPRKVRVHSSTQRHYSTEGAMCRE